MYSGQIVFSQLMRHLPRYDFDKCVKRYKGDCKARTFSCLDQFLCMAFAQITSRESLRSTTTCLQSVNHKLYHMGIRGNVSRSTLADANEKRNWRIYADFAQVLIDIARPMYANDDFGIDLEQSVYALDSTTISLCLSMFTWAHFRKHKAGVKLHTLLDLRGNIPTFMRVTNALLHDVNILDELVFEPGAFYVMDKGYLDFSRLYSINQSQSYFVEEEPCLQKDLLASNRQGNWTQVRPNHRAVKFLPKERLPRQSPTGPLRRHRKRPEPGAPDQLFLSGRTGHCPAVQVPMAGRTFLQMDQATSSDQGILRHIGQRCPDTDLDRSLDVCACGYHEKAASIGPQSLHTFSDFGHHAT